MKHFVFRGMNKNKEKKDKKNKTSNKIMFNLFDIQKQKENRVLKFYKTADSSQIYSYSDLYRDSINLSKCLEKLLENTTSDNCARCLNVAILLPVHSPALIPSIVGIENAGCVSCFLDPTEHIQYIKKRLSDDFETNIILCDLENMVKLNIEDEQVKIISNITLFDRNCILVRCESIKININRHPNNDMDDKNKSSAILFYASTSGSCGKVKPIGVTYKCFSPNIDSFGKLYRVTEADVIFVSSPPTFDPFMVDICLALQYGASLIMTCNRSRCNATELLNILFPCDEISEVTIMQTTPSLFMRWSCNEISNRIFSSNSQLRILAFGGEAFPATSQISKWMNWENSHVIRIFNLYGLTEMSCWAGIYEVTKDDILTNQRIPIGHPIDEQTAFQVTDGELLLKSKTRKCFQPNLTNAQVIDNDFEFILHTGDLVEVANDTRLYYTSRSNAIIKFYGRKINLCEIETCAKSIDGVEEAIGVHDEKHNSIVLFVKILGDFDDLKRKITKNLQRFGVHVKIYCVSDLPLTAHGKINRSDLLHIMHSDDDGKQSRHESIHLILQELVNESLGTQIELPIPSESSEPHKKPKQNIDLSFIHLGGTSLKAFQVVDEFERKISHSIPQVLTMLLDDRISIREILIHLFNAKQPSECLKKVDRTFLEMTPRWRIDMKKCIDATPTVCSLDDDMVIVSVGSHSKLLYNISVSDGEVISKLELPDRIESQVTQLGGCAIVGCYDGHLYCFDILTGCVKWKFDSGAMIKCRALAIDSRIIFGNYNESDNLWCLEATNEKTSLIWSQRIGTKSIYANPTKVDNEHCLVCCLDGTVALVNSISANLQWTFKAQAPVFSTPSVFINNQHETQIIIAAVNGKVYILSSDGIIKWQHQVNGNIFSSIECIMNPSDTTCTNFVFGSQNHYLYYFKMDSRGKYKEDWQHKTSASIRSTPILLRKDLNSYICIFSSDGVFKIINCDDGRLTYQSKIDGDVFSTPAIHDQLLFVGSRNNFLYCIDLTDFI